MNILALRRPDAVLVLAALCLPSAALLAESVPRSAPQRYTPIVVEDRGGIPAQPYYDDLGLPPQRPEGGLPPPATPPPAHHGEAALLPVRSTRLSPGAVDARPLDAPGLTPFFLVGDDPRSRAWLRQRQDQLRSLRAAGLVVNVESQQALDALRSLAPGLALFPASGDDLARRLGLRHYPALMTATGIEQ